MTDVFPKFIIEDGNLIIAKCKYHKQLVNDKDQDKVKGGGWWKIENDTLILFGDSYEFGQATFETIKTCINKGTIFSDKYKTTNISKKYKFAYYNGIEKIYFTTQTKLKNETTDTTKSI